MAATLATSDYRLWIDGAGVYRLCLGDEITIGGVRGAEPDPPGVLRLLAPLTSQHLTIRRSGESYIVEAGGPARLDGREITGPTLLRDGARLTLNAVELRFRLPHRLTRSALLEFLSSHRPAQALDGVVLMAEACLAGPAADCHLACPDMSETVLLMRDGDGLQGVVRHGRNKSERITIQHGTIIETSTRLRLERWS